MRRRIQVVWFGLFLVLVLGRSLRAQADAPPAHPLTLSEAIDYSLAHYPAVRAALEQLDSARNGVALARNVIPPPIESDLPN